MKMCLNRPLRLSEVTGVVDFYLCMLESEAFAKQTLAQAITKS